MTNKMSNQKKEYKQNKEYVETPWNIINSYFNGKHLKQLVRHQIESYNNFVTCQIQKTIDMFNSVRIVCQNKIILNQLININ